MKVVLKVGDKSLDFEGEDSSIDALKASLDTFFRLLDPEDATISQETVERMRTSAERLENVGENNADKG